MIVLTKVSDECQKKSCAKMWFDGYMVVLTCKSLEIFSFHSDN